MKYGELVHKVREQSPSAGREEAARSVSAVLGTLVERLPEGSPVIWSPSCRTSWPV